MDDERLKQMGGGGYWHELLNRIRDIRSSEKEQKINPDLVFRNPVFFDFPGHRDTYSEKDREIILKEY